MSIIGRGYVATASCIIASFMLIEGGGALFDFMNEQGLWQSRADGTSPTVMSRHGDDEEKGERGREREREREQLDENFPFIALYLSPSLPSSLSNVLLLAFRCSASPALSSCDGIVLHADESSIPPLYSFTPHPTHYFTLLCSTQRMLSHHPPRCYGPLPQPQKIPISRPRSGSQAKQTSWPCSCVCLCLCVSVSLNGLFMDALAGASYAIHPRTGGGVMGRAQRPGHISES